MYVGVDETGQDSLTGKKNSTVGLPFVRSNAGNPPVGDDDVRRLDSLGENVDNLPPRKQQIARFSSQGYPYAPTQKFNVPAFRGCPVG